MDSTRDGNTLVPNPTLSKDSPQCNTEFLPFMILPSSLDKTAGNSSESTTVCE